MHSETQIFLRSFGEEVQVALDALKERYGVDHKFSEVNPSLVLLKYNQIDCYARDLFKEKITRECRGMILDTKNDWRCVARGFDKFFNQGEALAADILMNSATIQEKMDGSLCLLYHYDGAWHVATTGSPDAAGPVNTGTTTFAELFWSVFREEQLDVPTNINICLVFELCTPENRVVIPHTNRRLYLLGGRDLRDQRELYPAAFVRHCPSARRPPSYKSLDFDAELNKEGFVVVDAEFNRIKVKDPRYLKWHKTKDGLSDAWLWEQARDGNSPEALAYFPELKPQFEVIENQVRKLKAYAAMAYQDAKDALTQKDFAFKVNYLSYAPLLFRIHKHPMKFRACDEILKEFDIDWIKKICSTL